MYINKPSVTKLEVADRPKFCIVLAAGLNSTDLENMVKCLYPCPDMRHFTTVIKKTLAFRHRNQTLDKTKIDFKTTLHVASGRS